MTQQFTQPAGELKGLSNDDIKKHMSDAFHCEVQGGTLEEDEVKMLADCVQAGLDTDQQGEVSYDEFVHACSSNEHCSSKTMIQFFDDERKTCITERIFDDTRGEIKRLQALCKDIKEREKK